MDAGGFVMAVTNWLRLGLRRGLPEFVSAAAAPSSALQHPSLFLFHTVSTNYLDLITIDIVPYNSVP